MTPRLNKYFFIFFIFLIYGCGTSPQRQQAINYNNQNNCSEYQNRPTTSICTTYWNNSDTRCDAVIRSEFTKRGVSSSKNSCGEPLYCSKYIGSSPSDLCKTYWSNLDTKCDPFIRGELERRDLQGSADSSVCGTPKNNKNIQNNNSQKNTSCNYSFSELDTRSICGHYWNNAYPQCDSRMADELQKRQVFASPKDQCGVKFNNSSASQTPTIQNNAVTTTSIPSKNSNKGKCDSVVENLTSSQNPVSAACELRYNSMSKESVVCRTNIVSFINMNSKGVGTSLTSCGLK